MLVLVRSFSYTPHADHNMITVSHCVCWIGEKFPSPRAGFTETGHVFLLYCSCNHYTEIESHMLCLDRTKTQEQGLPGYSSVRLTSRASHRLDKCRLSWVWLGFGLLSALSECSACLERGSHRHASSGFVSVQTDQTAQSWRDLVRTSVFFLIFFFLHWLCCFSEEFLLHSSSWL